MYSQDLLVALKLAADTTETKCPQLLCQALAMSASAAQHRILLLLPCRAVAMTTLLPISSAQLGSNA